MVADKALEVAAEQPFAPATPLLVLNAISHLQFGTAAAAVPYQALYQRAAGAIMEAADAAGVYELSNPSLLSPQVGLAHCLPCPCTGQCFRESEEVLKLRMFLAPLLCPMWATARTSQGPT